MIYSVIFNILCSICIAVLIKYKLSDKRLINLRTDKRILETQLKERTFELELSIKHANESRQRTIKSKKDLSDAKQEVYQKYNYNNVDSAMQYINGTE